jgi:hypothetical protein
VVVDVHGSPNPLRPRVLLQLVKDLHI